MANPLNSMVHTRLEAVITMLSKHGVTDVHGEAILKNPKRLVEAVVAALNAELGLTESSSIGRTLMTLVLPAGKTGSSYAADLAAAGFRVSEWTDEPLCRMPVVAQETEVELVVASVAELGFDRETRYDDIRRRAASLGLGLCPAAAGPALRLAHWDQPMGEWLVVAMKPVADARRSPRVFAVGRDTVGLWLNGHCGYPDDLWGPSPRFVFVRRK